MTKRIAAGPLRCVDSSVPKTTAGFTAAARCHCFPANGPAALPHLLPLGLPETERVAKIPVCFFKVTCFLLKKGTTCKLFNSAYFLLSVI